MKLYYRLQKVQWPTVLSYLDDPDADVKAYLDCLKAKRENCSIEVAQKMDLGDYGVEWVPDTVFQLAIMVSLAKENLVKNEQGALRGLRLPEDLAEAHYNNFIDRAVDLEPRQMMSAYLKASIEFGHQFDQVYFKALQYYSQLWERDWESQIDLMLTQWIQMVGFAERPLETPVYFNITSYPLRDFLDPYHGETLKAYVREEVKAAKHNHFLLSRGTKGMDVIIKHRKEETVIPLFDIPTLDYSISFGGRILDGSMLDMNPRLGARSLGYFYDTEERKSKLGYLLELPILGYLEGFSKRREGGTTLFNLFYIPPLSCISGLFGRAEAFHPRTKLGFDKDDGYNGAGRPKLLAAERNKEAGIFRAIKTDKMEWNEYMQKVLADLKPLDINDGELKREFKLRKAGQQRLPEYLKKPVYSMERVKQKTMVAIQKHTKLIDLPIIFSNVRYSEDNVFYRLLTSSFETQIYEQGANAIAFEDHKPRVHTHILVIPSNLPEAKHVQFLNLIYLAFDNEIEGFFRTIHKTAEAASWKRALNPKEGEDVAPRDLVRHGYRVVMNNYGMEKRPNHAHQEVPHMHAHIGGGECLRQIALDGIKTTAHEIRKEVLFTEYAEEDLDLIIKVYKVPMSSTQPAEFIFEMTDVAGEHLYESIHDFSQQAPAYQIRRLGERLLLLAQKEGFINTGYRIYSNHGPDAHHDLESHFRLHVAYGAFMGPTLSSCLEDTRDYTLTVHQNHAHFSNEMS